jgi:hypothetical protein
MKILTFKRLVGLTVIGGVAYIHKQRGGEWTVASITDTLKHLWSSALGKLGSVQEPTKPPGLDYSRAAPGTEPVNTQGSPGRSPRDRAVNPTEEPRSYSDVSKRKDDPGHH